MAIKVNNVTVIDDSRNATVVNASANSLTYSGTNVLATAAEINQLDGVTDNVQSQLDGSAAVVGTLDRTFTSGETVSLTLSESVPTPIVSVIKEIPQTGVTNNDWDVASDGANYTLHDTAYDTTLTPGEIGFAIDSASYDSVSYDVSSLVDIPVDLSFSNDGSKMFVSDYTTDAIYEYSLSEPFNINQASYNNVQYDVSSLGSNLFGLCFNGDGTKLYTIVRSNQTIFQHTLTTGFDLSTASYDNVSYNVGFSIQAIELSSDNSRIYVANNSSDIIRQIILSTPSDLSTASTDPSGFDYSNEFTNAYGVVVSNDGTQFFAFSNSDIIYKYEMSTPFDITSGSYTGIAFDVRDIAPGIQGLAFSSDGAKMFVSDNNTDSVYQYTTSTSSFVLGTGSFASTDVGKRIVGNGGEAVLTAADGSYELQTAFNDDSTIAAGDWSMFALDVESADAGLILSNYYVIGDTTVDYSQFPYFFYNNTDIDGMYMVSSVDGSLSDSIGFSSSADNAGSAAVGFQTGRLYVGTNEGIEAFDVDYANGNISNRWNNDISTNNGNEYGVVLNKSETQLYVANYATDQIEIYDPDSGDFISVFASVTSISPEIQPFIDFYGNVYVPTTDGVKALDSNGSTKWSYTDGTSNTNNLAFDVVSNNIIVISNNDIIVIDADDGSVVISEIDITTVIIRGGSIDRNGNIIVVDSDDNVYKYDNNLNLIWSVGSTSTGPYELLVDHNNDIYLVGNNGDAKLDPNGNIIWETTLQGGLSNNCAAAAWYNQNILYSTTTLSYPTNANHTAITTASTDTEFWTDINSMTADDSVNDGAVYYAVSTDDRTTWSIIDDTEGVRNIVRNNGGTWEVNDASDYGTETWVAATENDEFYALEEAVDVSTAQIAEGFAPANQWSYDGVSFDVSGQDGFPASITFNNNGTKMYISGIYTDSAYQYSLSTAFDLSTASYDNVSLNISGQAANPAPRGIVFSNDGTKMYVSEEDDDLIYQYDLSTSFDLSSASYNNVNFSVSGQTVNPTDIAFNDDGTRMYVVEKDINFVFQYSLSAPFDLSTASYNNVSFDASTEAGVPRSIKFNNDGTKMYIIDGVNDSIFQYTLSTAFDLSTAGYDNVSFSVSGEESNGTGVAFNNDGTKIYVVGENTQSVHQYSSGTTTSTNRMDADQLNAVSDANHYTLGNDLDLAITLFMADGNTNSPTSDGVSINYDANVLNQGAVLGTDYEFDAPAGDTVRIKALSDENFKVKVI